MLFAKAYTWESLRKSIIWKMQIYPVESNSRNRLRDWEWVRTSWGYRLCNFGSLEKCPEPFFRIKSGRDCVFVLLDGRSEFVRVKRNIFGGK